MRKLSDAAAKMVTTVEIITGEIAEAWLNRNYAANRPIRWSHVRKLCTIILEGRWKLTSQGVCFDTNGQLIDGQHRLWAIVQACEQRPHIALEMSVTRGAPTESFIALDQNRVRSVSDLSEDKWATPKIVAIARAYSRGVIQSHVGAFNDRDPELLLEFTLKNKDLIQGVLDLMPENEHMAGRRFLTAPVVAAIVRASHTVSRARLDRFVVVLMSGITEDVTERAVILLRDYMSSPDSKGHHGGSIIYQKAQRAIRAFVAKDPISSLMAAPQDLYPIPGVATRHALPTAQDKSLEQHGKRRLKAPKTTVKERVTKRRAGNE